MSRTSGKPRQLRRGQTAELYVTRIAPSGDGVGALDDALEVHVAEALPGDRIRARIAHVSQHAARAYATLDEVVAPSPARRQPPCRHQGHCTGCPLMIADEASQRRFKRAMLHDEWGLDVEALRHEPAAELRYRWSSKRVVGRRGPVVLLGSYRRRSHEVANMRHCLVDHPAIAACAREVGDAAGELGIEPYREQDRSGLLRYGWFKTDGSDAVLLCLVLARPDEQAARRLAERLTTPAGVSWCVQSSDGNVLRGEGVTQLTGEAELAVDLAGVDIPIGPLGFLQPNPTAAALAYRDLLAAPDGTPLTGAVALDLFAGAGATTALLRERFDSVVPCELYPESAARLGVQPERAAELTARFAADSADGPVDLVVANPPRSGLGPELCGRLNALAASRLQVMSCSPAGLQRDLQALTSSDGAYGLAGVRAYDTLPQTPHVELVAWLTRR